MAQRAGRRSTARNRAGAFCLALSFLFTLAALGAPIASAASVAIESAGPLTRIEVGATLSCFVTRDPPPAATQRSEFFGGNACGTFLAVGATVYGPADIATLPPSILDFTPVSQTKIGLGTLADPYKIVSVVTAGAFTLTETDTYVVGQETYRTDVAVTNNGDADATVTVYRAGDCKLNQSDGGFGRSDTFGPGIACTTQDPIANPNTAILEWRALTPGATFFEGTPSGGLWPAIASGQPFANFCQCAPFHDNGAGLSWTAVIPAKGTASFSQLTTISPTGKLPLSIAKTPQSSLTDLGVQNRYTITITNPNNAPVNAGPITDRLPSGFAYLNGSTLPLPADGGPGEPMVGGLLLTWNGPVAVAAKSVKSFSFGVGTPNTPGTFFNNVRAEASGGFSVAPTNETAPIVLSPGGTTTTSTSTTTTTSTSATTSTSLAGDTTTTTSTTVAGGATATTSTTAAGGSTTSTTAAGGATTTTSASGSGSGSGGSGSGSSAGATTTTARSGAAAGSANPLATTGSNSRQQALVAAVALAVGGLLLLTGRDEPVPPPRKLSDWEIRNGPLRPPPAGR